MVLAKEGYRSMYVNARIWQADGGKEEEQKAEKQRKWTGKENPGLNTWDSLVEKKNLWV